MFDINNTWGDKPPKNEDFLLTPMPMEGEILESWDGVPDGPKRFRMGVYGVQLSKHWEGLNAKISKNHLKIPRDFWA